MTVATTCATNALVTVKPMNNKAATPTSFAADCTICSRLCAPNMRSPLKIPSYAKNRAIAGKLIAATRISGRTEGMPR